MMMYCGYGGKMLLKMICGVNSYIAKLSMKHVSL